MFQHLDIYHIVAHIKGEIISLCFFQAHLNKDCQIEETVKGSRRKYGSF